MWRGQCFNNAQYAFLIMRLKASHKHTMLETTNINILTTATGTVFQFTIS